MTDWRLTLNGFREMAVPLSASSETPSAASPPTPYGLEAAAHVPVWRNLSLTGGVSGAYGRANGGGPNPLPIPGVMSSTTESQKARVLGARAGVSLFHSFNENWGALGSATLSRQWRTDERALSFVHTGAGTNVTGTDALTNKSTSTAFELSAGLTYNFTPSFAVYGQYTFAPLPPSISSSASTHKTAKGSATYHDPFLGSQTMPINEDVRADAMGVPTGAASKFALGAIVTFGDVAKPRKKDVEDEADRDSDEEPVEKPARKARKAAPEPEPEVAEEPAPAPIKRRPPAAESTPKQPAAEAAPEPPVKLSQEDPKAAETAPEKSVAEEPAPEAAPKPAKRQPKREEEPAPPPAADDEIPYQL